MTGDAGADRDGQRFLGSAQLGLVEIWRRKRNVNGRIRAVGRLLETRNSIAGAQQRLAISLERPVAMATFKNWGAISSVRRVFMRRAARSPRRTETLELAISGGSTERNGKYATVRLTGIDCYVEKFRDEIRRPGVFVAKLFLVDALDEEQRSSVSVRQAANVHQYLVTEL